MINWEIYNRNLQQNAEHSYQKNEIKHALELAKLEANAANIDLNVVQEGRSKLDMLKAKHPLNAQPHTE